MGKDNFSQALNIPMLVVGLVVLVVIVVALFPTLEQSLGNLTNVNSSNPLLSAIRPALPFMTGLAILIFILMPIITVIKELKKKF